jgi:hypothetical protein
MAAPSPPASSPFASAVAKGDYAAALKALDEAIDKGNDERASLTARLAQMHVNRGVCHQRLHLNRKALKVRLILLARPGDGSPAARRARVARRLPPNAPSSSSPPPPA